MRHAPSSMNRDGVRRRLEKAQIPDGPWLAPPVDADSLSRLGHELKTPLVTVKGYAELLLDQTQEPLSPRLREWVRTIASAANRIDATVRKLLGETRAAEGQTYRPAALDPARWFARCVDEARVLAPSRKLDWQWEVSPDTPSVALDPEAGRDLLLELLQNAARATPDGGRVTVKGSPEDRNGRPGVRVSVEDTGVGVHRGPEGEEFFERFVVGGCLSAHRSGEFEHGAEGIGVGLAMVRGVARAHAGEAWVEARGRDAAALPGTAFCVWLPAADAAKADTATLSVSGDRGRLLVADADPEVSRILAVALESSYDVEPAATPEEAPAKWGAWGDGWQACLFDPSFCDGEVAFVKALRAVPNSKNWPILVYAQGSSYFGTEALRAAGVDDYLFKPVRTRVILQHLEALQTRKPR